MNHPNNPYAPAGLPPPALMDASGDVITVCAWCPTKAMADAWALNRGYTVSHGICPICSMRLLGKPECKLVVPAKVETPVAQLSPAIQDELAAVRARLKRQEDAQSLAEVFADMDDDRPLSDADLDRMAEQDHIRLQLSPDGQHDMRCESNPRRQVTDPDRAPEL